MKEQILDQIDHYDTIMIHRHIRPDPDALGSQGGLADMIQATYPAKNVYVVGSDDPSLAFLNEMDDVRDKHYEGALVIVCDTANQERINDQRYEQGDYLIKIDHHPNEDPYGDLIWVDTSASSVSEMIYTLYEAGKTRGFVLPERAAYLLYAGIVGDTGRFMFDSTTEETFRVASKLRAYGFSINAFYTNLYKMKESIARLMGYVLQTFQMSAAGAGSIKLDAGVLAKFGATASDASQLVHAVADVEGMKAWVFFIEEPEQIRVRLRSKGPRVNDIAKKYKGGGHALAAGATIYKWADAPKVIEDLEAACWNDVAE